MLRWPKRARAALVHLFRPLQDVDVYVEDANDEVLYTELFRRIAPLNTRIARVFCAGDRSAVIKIAQDYDFDARPALFLIDGDFEWVRDEPAPQFRGIYRIEAYCIENLLIQEVASIQIIIEEAAIPENEARTLFDCESWLNELTPLVDLAVSFAALNVVDSSLPTIGLGVGRVLTAVCKGQPPHLDPAKVARLREETNLKAVAVVGVEAFNTLRAKILARVTKLDRPLDCISGKDFILPLFEFRLWDRIKRKTARRSLRLRLARHCDRSQFIGLAAALDRARPGIV